MIRVLAFALCLLAMGAQAHQVTSTTTAAPATVVTLSYADGKPFTYEAYELYAGDGELPYQVGRSDARGRVVFLAEGAGPWRLRAFTEDGHGIDTALQANASGTPGKSRSDWSLAVLGGALLLALFGIYQLFLRKRL
jgi:nickel transport protein